MPHTLFHPLSSPHLLGRKGTWKNFFILVIANEASLSYFMMTLRLFLTETMTKVNWGDLGCSSAAQCACLASSRPWVWFPVTTTTKWIKVMTKPVIHLRIFQLWDSPLVCGLFLLPSPATLSLMMVNWCLGSYQSPRDILQSLSPFWVDFIFTSFLKNKITF